MKGNGKSFKPHSVSVPKDNPDMAQMIQDIWVWQQMTNLKLYGDKEKKVVGITDEIITLNTTLSPLVKDFERRKLIRRWLLIPLTFAGGALGTWAKNYIETHYLK